MNVALNPAERLIVLSLTLIPNQTAEQLSEVTGIHTIKYLLRILRSLRLAQLITSETSATGGTTYSAATPAVQQ